MADVLSWIGSGLGDVGSAIGSGVEDIGSAIGSGLSDIGNWLGLTGSASAAPAASGGGAANAAGSAAGSAAAAAGASTPGLFGELGSGLSDVGSWLLGSSGAPAASGSMSLTSAAAPAIDPSLAQSILFGSGGGNAVAAPLSLASVAPAAAAAGGASAPTGIMGMLDALGKPQNLIALGGLGLSALMKPSLPSAIGQAGATAQQQQQQAQGLETAAAPLSAEANQLISSATTGQLPPGGQAVLDQAQQAADAQTRSMYADMGLSGPSSGEASALSNIDLARAAQQYSMAQQAAGTGLSAQQLASQMLSAAMSGLGSASQTYSQIGQIQLAQDQQLSNALAAFAAASAGNAGYNAALAARNHQGLT